MIQLRHFSPDRDPWLYRCRCDRPACEAPPPTAALLSALDVMREDLGEAIVVDSGPRCALHNSAEGGAPESEHLTGEGADLQCLTSVGRWKMLDSAKRAGFRRLGIGRNFIHVGIDTSDRVQNVAWTYYAHSRSRQE